LDHATFAHHPSLPPRGGGTLGIAGRARQQHLHKCSSGEDIEEESVVSSRSLRVSSSPTMELFTAAHLLTVLDFWRLNVELSALLARESGRRGWEGEARWPWNVGR